LSRCALPKLLKPISQLLGFPSGCGASRFRLLNLQHRRLPPPSAFSPAASRPLGSAVVPLTPEPEGEPLPWRAVQNHTTCSSLLTSGHRRQGAAGSVGQSPLGPSWPADSSGGKGFGARHQPAPCCKPKQDPPVVGGSQPPGNGAGWEENRSWLTDLDGTSRCWGGRAGQQRCQRLVLHQPKALIWPLEGPDAPQGVDMNSVHGYSGLLALAEPVAGPDCKGLSLEAFLGCSARSHRGQRKGAQAKVPWLGPATQKNPDRRPGLGSCD